MSRNTNEEFLSVLSQYDGSVDDRRKKYLQDTYGFSSNSALPSMEYQVLGDLGYTGTIDDRWSKYLKALGGTGLSSKAELLSSTFYGFYSANSLSPEFVLDFERETYLTDSTSSAFSDALTFTRSGSATYVDSTGTLQTAADGEPRRGHHVWDGSQWVNKGLLLESESRTNLITYSEDFTDASWTKTRASVSSNQSITPDGNTTADKLVEDTSLATTHLVEVSVPGSANDFTYSFWAKAAERTSVQVQRSSLETTGFAHIFDLSAGTAITVDGPGSANIEDYGNGFYKCSGTLSHSAATNTGIRIVLRDDSGSSVYDGDGTSGIYIWGAQFELGSTPSSYIPTSGSTVTRAGETLTAPSDNLPWPEPVVIGDELVTQSISGYIDSQATGVDLTVSDETLIISNNTGGMISPRVGSNDGFSVESGKVYKASVTVIDSQGSAGPELLSVGKGVFFSTYESASLNSSGETSLVFVADADDIYYTYLSFSSLEDGASRTISEISIKEINPLAVSIAMEGGETFADLDTAGQVALYDRRVDANNRITLTLDTDGAKTGTFTLTLVNGGSTETISTTGEITPDVNEPFNVAFVATSNELGIALNGTAETRVSHSLGLPDLSTVDATYEGMGTRAVVREWADDITNAGMEAATS